MNVLITGGNGRAGWVIFEGLKHKFNITTIDINRRDTTLQKKIEKIMRDRIRKRKTKSINLLNYKKLVKAMQGMDVVMHLAFDMREADEERIIPENKTMLENVLEAAKETGIKRVIIPSSIEADDFRSGKTMTIERKPEPQTMYGITKVYSEMLGKYYSNFFEVICIRLGHLQTDNQDVISIKKADFVNLIDQCLTQKVPAYSLFYAVSEHPKRIHSVENPLGWKPL